MTTVSPIFEHLKDLGPHTMPWGDGPEAPLVIGSFGALEFEYADLRRSCVLVDQPQRSVVELTGPDALPFLDRMLTQKLDDLRSGESRSSFWLNRQGRIVADVRVVAVEEKVLLDVDAAAASNLVESLGQFIFTEDLELKDARAAWYRCSLHGPNAISVVATAIGEDIKIEPGQVQAGSIQGVKVVIERCDSCGEPGLEVFVPGGQAVNVWMALTHCTEQADIRLRPAGWHAYNIARIESGTPMFQLDYGTDALPAETGVVESRVSFKKGCYLGQEIVARMHNLGHPKQKIVGLRMDSPDDIESWQPVTGTPLFAQGSEQPVGAVTSSTLSPMLGGEPICLAMVRWAQTLPGTRLMMRDADHQHGCSVQADLQFWPRRPSA